MSSRLRVYYNKNVKIHSAVGHLECLEGRREKKKRAVVVTMSYQ